MSEKYSKPANQAGTSNRNPVRAPFSYYGAKQRLARRIVDTLPPHNAWVEMFCGSAALTLAKNPAPIEVINDKDDQIVNLFTQIRDNSDALCRAVALTPCARAEFQSARASTQNQDPIERARLFLVASMMTVNSAIGGSSGFSFSQSFAREEREARVNRWYNLPSRIEAVVERLRSVRIENRDALELLGMFADRPATLVYLDPPYFVKRDQCYIIDANNREFHEDLLDACVRMKCMMLISGYRNELYDSILTPARGWKKEVFRTHTRDTTGKDFERTEVLWMNNRYVKARESGKVPIRLTAKEKAEKKVNPSRRR